MRIAAGTLQLMGLRKGISSVATRQTGSLQWRLLQIVAKRVSPLGASVELLPEKGVLSKPEILERIKKLQSETKVCA